jgi:hypothetical protein
MAGIGGCIQKFPDWLPGARTANGTALCHYMQLYHYFVTQSNEFCHNNPLKGTATSNTKVKLYFIIDSVHILCEDLNCEPNGRLFYDGDEP